MQIINSEPMSGQMFLICYTNNCYMRVDTESEILRALWQNGINARIWKPNEIQNAKPDTVLALVQFAEFDPLRQYVGYVTVQKKYLNRFKKNMKEEGCR